MAPPASTKETGDLSRPETQVLGREFTLGTFGPEALEGPLGSLPRPRLRVARPAAADVCRSRKGEGQARGPRVNGLWQTRYFVPLRDGAISLLPIDNLTWHNLFKGHPELAFDGFTYIKTYSITG
jgi:hypothetical protein